MVKKIKPTSGDEAGTGKDIVSTPPPGISGGGADDDSGGDYGKELLGHETAHTRQKGQVQFGDGLMGPKPKRESSNWTDYNVHDPGVAILKKVAIPIIVVLVAACATLGFLYVQESNKLEDAQQALNTNIEKNSGLQAEINALQRDILASEAEAKTLSESLDVAKAAIRNTKE